MNPDNISLITIAPFGTWSDVFQTTISVNSQQYSSGIKESGIQYWVLDRYNPTAKPLFEYFQVAEGAMDQVPPGIEEYVDDDYIIIVCSQSLFVTQVPQGDLYNFLVSIGAGSQLEMLEQINTYYACGFTGRIAYNLITTPCTSESGLESGLIPQSVYTASSSDKEYGSETYPGALLVAQLIPTEFNDKTIYTPVLTTQQSV